MFYNEVRLGGRGDGESIVVSIQIFAIRHLPIIVPTLIADAGIISGIVDGRTYICSVFKSKRIICAVVIHLTCSREHILVGIRSMRLDTNDIPVIAAGSRNCTCCGLIVPQFVKSSGSSSALVSVNLCYGKVAAHVIVVNDWTIVAIADGCVGICRDCFNLLRSIILGNEGNSHSV